MDEKEVKAKVKDIIKSKVGDVLIYNIQKLNDLKLIYSEEYNSFLIRKDSINTNLFGINTVKEHIKVLEEANKLLKKKK